MDEMMRSDERESEIAALNHEIYELTRKLEEQEQAHLMSTAADPMDPFGNPTDYKSFSGDYSKILPRLGEPGYTVPLEPDSAERKALRKYYSIGGWCTIFQFAASNLIAIVLFGIINIILRKLNPDVSSASISDYIRSSSILVSLNALIYLVCNVLNAYIGMKWAGIKAKSLIRTKDFGLGIAVQYCMIGLFLWIISIYLSSGANAVFSKFGIDILVNREDTGVSYMGKAISMIYGCIIAPLTEEIFFRGMLLRVFSKANQRFAVFATAVFFGLAHGNIPQFILGFMAGVFFAHITLKHSSIVPAVIVHMFINTFSTMFGILGKSDRNIQFMSTMLLFAAAILGMIMFLIFHSTDELPSTTPAQKKRGVYTAVGSLPLFAAFLIEVSYMMMVLLS